MRFAPPESIGNQSVESFAIRFGEIAGFIKVGRDIENTPGTKLFPVSFQIPSTNRDFISAAVMTQPEHGLVGMGILAGEDICPDIFAIEHFAVW
jgi:hypothetical protein